MTMTTLAAIPIPAAPPTAVAAMTAMMARITKITMQINSIRPNQAN